jgi:hypothetical protein
MFPSLGVFYYEMSLADEDQLYMLLNYIILSQYFGLYWPIGLWDVEDPTDGCEVVILTHRSRSTPQKRFSAYSFLLEAE